MRDPLHENVRPDKRAAATGGAFGTITRLHFAFGRENSFDHLFLQRKHVLVADEA